MKPSTVITAVIAVPVLALFVGVGVLSMRIGDHWTEATTASLVTGLTTVCGGGFVVLSLIVAIIVGIPFAIRMFGESGRANSTWATLPPPPRYASGLPTWQEARPPMLEAKPDGGQWLTQGPGSYDLWKQDQDPAAGQVDPYGNPLQ